MGLTHHSNTPSFYYSVSQKRRCHFVEKALELPGLIPRGHSQCDVFQPSIEIGLQFFDALFRIACGRKTLDELHAKVGRVVFVQKGFAFGEGSLAVFVDGDVMVKRAADS